MWRLLAAFLSCMALAIAAPASASIGTPVNQGTAEDSSGGVFIIDTTLANATAGSLMFIQYSVNSSSGTVPVCADGLGNVYTNGDTTGAPTVGYQWAFYSILTAPVPSGTVITCTQAGITANKTIQVLSASGIGAYDAPRSTSGGFATASSATNSTGSPLANANSLVLAWGAVVGNATTVTNSGGWTLVNSAGTATGTHATVSYQIVASTASVTITQTYGSSVGWSLGEQVFGASASAAATPHNLLTLGAGG